MRRRIGRPGLVGTMARTAVIAKTAQAVAGGGPPRPPGAADDQAARLEALETRTQLAEMQARLDEASTGGASPGPAVSDDLLAGLQQLADLKTAGLLSDEEFETAKARLLGS
jgi:hypothetical protein